MNEVILEMKDIGKEFPGVRALDNVTLTARKGEVLALVGENGAGKSTLMKVLSGVWAYPDYEGEIKVRGEVCRFKGTRDAEKARVAIIYQELNLIQDLSVAENIFLDRQFTNKLGIIDWDRLRAETIKILSELHIKDIDPMQSVKELTVGKQQMVEIAKALTLKAEILILDEPTSALTDRETDELFRVIRRLKNDGVCMIYISHKMEELKQIADRVQVLRDGKTIGSEVPVAEVTIDEIISRMVGRDLKTLYPKHTAQRGKKILEVHGFEVDHPLLPGEKVVRDVSFDVYQGEILGIAGLMGAGRSELVMGLFGAWGKSARGKVVVDGREIVLRSPKDAIDAGIALVTEDRKLLGLLLEQDIVFNTTLASLNRFVKMGMLDQDGERKTAEHYVKELGVKTPTVDARIANLSGGNQQKVVIGKWLNTQPKLLILDEPTRGIDIGAKVEIYKLMNSLMEKGVAIVMISSELPEVMGMSDRVLVMCEGKLSADLICGETSKERVMEYATGSAR
ncbi:MAG: D-xylose ABC transporter ATP-binding protein [Spirochaetes bacterium GWF1_51_8]|nr:MAG: D-xylose ABC transporter ATP-binding protein [Spirochaetes bacterium GWF1_51_8]